VNLPVAHALARVKATRQQVGLTASERALNVQGAFRVPEAARAGGGARGRQGPPPRDRG
jgi:predicted amidophosphoribosyltransferase